MFDSRSCGLTAMLLFLALPVAGPRGLQTTGRTADKDALRFEIFEDRDKEFRWRLKHGEEIIGTSGQGYKAKESCKRGVALIKSEADSDKLTFEAYEDNAGQHRWRVKSANGEIVAASSQGYKSKAACTHAIDLIKKGASKAEVD